MIYSPDTLNTNQATLNYLAALGIKCAFLAREIPLDEKIMIAQNTAIKTVTQIHGVEYMAYSKRKLLSNYFMETGLEKSALINDNIIIQTIFIITLLPSIILLMFLIFFSLSYIINLIYSSIKHKTMMIIYFWFYLMKLR